MGRIYNMADDFDDSQVDENKFPVIFEAAISDYGDIELYSNEFTNEIYIYNDQQLSYSIQINPSEGYRDSFIKDPYIKVYDNISYNKSRNCIRVFIFTPKYTYHKDRFGNLPWSMSLANFLNDAMNKPSIARGYTNKTVFESILDIIQISCNLTDEENKILRSQKLIDFRTIKK